MIIIIKGLREADAEGAHEVEAAERQGQGDHPEVAVRCVIMYI